MKNIRIRNVVFGLLVFLVLMTAYLAYLDLSGGGEGFCIIDGEGNTSCTNVQNSQYGSFLGVRLVYWGFGSFLLAFVVYLVANTPNKYRRKAHKVFFFMMGFGAIIALILIAIQFFVLQAMCSTCLVIDFGTIIIFYLVHLEDKKRR